MLAPLDRAAMQNQNLTGMLVMAAGPVIAQLCWAIIQSIRHLMTELLWTHVALVLILFYFRGSFSIERGRICPWFLHFKHLTPETTLK
jgi:hypothetical protein